MADKDSDAAAHSQNTTIISKSAIVAQSDEATHTPAEMPTATDKAVAQPRELRSTTAAKRKSTGNTSTLIGPPARPQKRTSNPTPTKQSRQIQDVIYLTTVTKNQSNSVVGSNSSKGVIDLTTITKNQSNPVVGSNSGKDVIDLTTVTKNRSDSVVGSNSSSKAAIGLTTATKNQSSSVIGSKSSKDGKLPTPGVQRWSRDGLLSKATGKPVSADNMKRPVFAKRTHPSPIITGTMAPKRPRKDEMAFFRGGWQSEDHNEEGESDAVSEIGAGGRTDYAKAIDQEEGIGLARSESKAGGTGQPVGMSQAESTRLAGPTGNLETELMLENESMLEEQVDLEELGMTKRVGELASAIHL